MKLSSVALLLVLSASPAGKMVLVPGDKKSKPFKLDATEVTVADYGTCVKAGKCTPPSTTGLDPCNWGVRGKEQHPVNCVDWYQADAYCKAQGKRLPDQAEWQRAASNGGRTRYPWGDSNPDNTHAQWRYQRDGTAEVGTHPAGATPSGIHDLSGNVSEWMSNDYNKKFRNDGVKEVRGGAWDDSNERSLLAKHQNANPPDLRVAGIGFRCAQDP
jgi:formylglycine-generating enzyme required for sulfatase activity